MHTIHLYHQHPNPITFSWMLSPKWPWGAVVFRRQTYAKCQDWPFLLCGLAVHQSKGISRQRENSAWGERGSSDPEQCLIKTVQPLWVLTQTVVRPLTAARSNLVIDCSPGPCPHPCLAPIPASPGLALLCSGPRMLVQPDKSYGPSSQKYTDIS